MNRATTRFFCKNLASNKSQTITESGSSASLVHRAGDPPDVNRIIASVNGFEVELLPSKGFSIGQVYLNGQPKLWNPPIDICNPETLDLFSNEIAINGTPAHGFTFLKTFCGGIEFYGLRNWGMPARDEKTNMQHPIHGETSNIPVEYCDVEINDMEIVLTASFVYRNISHRPGGTWYLQGCELFEVIRRVILKKDNQQLQLIDRIKNISKELLKPDWGYHITFLPFNGSRLLVPSASAENRSGDKVPNDFDRWSPAKNDEVREETGIILKGLKTVPSEYKNLSYALVVHPNLSGIKASFPKTPYFQTWFCKGGAYSNEFTKVSNGKPLFTRNWDGMGIEIGSSALDHNGNTDPAINEQNILNPCDSKVITLFIDFVDENESQQLAKKIQEHNKNRLLLSKS